MVESNTDNRLKVVSILLVSIVMVTIAKATAALLTGSLFLKAETFDSLLDIINISIIYFAVNFSMNPPDRDHHYGHGKAESLAAFLEALFILFVVMLILYESIQHILNPTPIGNYSIGLSILASIILIDLALFIYSRRAAVRYLSPALEACSVNLLGDLARSIPEIICFAFIAFSGFYIFDVAVSIILSIILARESYKLLFKSSGILLDRAPTGIAEKMSLILSGLDVVENIKRIRVRSLGDKLQVDLSLSIKSDSSITEAHSIADYIEEKVKALYRDADVTIHIEPPQKADLESLIKNTVFRNPKVKNIHSIRAYNLGSKLALIFHVELDPSIPLDEAHRVSEEIEDNLRGVIPNLGFISIHTESSLERSEATLKEVEYREMLTVIEEARRSIEGIEEIHEATVIESKGTKVLTLHIELKPDIRLREAHQIASNIEAYLKEKLKVDEVYIHLEPRKPLNQELDIENTSSMDP